jgi:ribosomal protein L39E
MWVLTVLGVEGPFHKHHLRPSENTDIYIMIPNSSKITVMRQQRNNVMVGGWVVTTTQGTVISSIRKVENYRCRGSQQRERER